MNIVQNSKTEKWDYTFSQAELARAKKVGFVAEGIAFEEEYSYNGCHFYLFVEAQHTQADIEKAKKFLYHNRDVTGISLARLESLS